ncbi:MAG TPA: universal stress protein [Thermoanaerobaculia bacterium]
MFARVLFATDFSPASDRALDCLVRWKRFGLTKVTLAHVHDVHTAGGLEGPLRREDEPKIDRQASVVTDRGLWASTRVEVGIPYFDLDRIAREEGCEAIVIGSHGASWLAEVMIGSIADAVLRHSTFPVFVIKANYLAGLTEGECEEACTSLFTDILFATDLSPESEGALALVERLCRKYRSTVRLLHVIETKGVWMPHIAGYHAAVLPLVKASLDALANALTAAGASSVAVDVIREHRVRGILHEIETRKPGLVVLGRHGHGHLAELLVGSTSHGVARLSPRPVLVVPRLRVLPEMLSPGEPAVAANNDA